MNHEKIQIPQRVIFWKSVNLGLDGDKSDLRFTKNVCIIKPAKNIYQTTLQRFQNKFDPDSVFLPFFLGLQLPDLKLFQEITKLCGKNSEARFGFASYQFALSFW